MAFQINSKKIAKNTITLYIRQFVTMLISFFTVRVTLNQLGVENYGLNNLVGSIVSMFSFINGSMGTAVQRFYSYEIGKENENKLKKVFGVGLFLHIIVAFITLLIAEFFAIVFLKKMNIPTDRLFTAQVVFQISIITLILGIVTVPYSALLRARELFSKTALIEIIQALLRLGNLYLLTVIRFDKLIVLAVLNFLVSCGGLLAFIVLAFSFEETHSGPIYDKQLIKEMLKFVSLLLLTVLASMINTQGLVMLINVFFGLAINAAYGVAVQVQNAVTTFATNFKHSMVPQIMAAYGAEDYKSMNNMINFGTKITFLLLLMITFPIMFCIDWILMVWLKQPPESTSNFVILVLIYVNISSFTYFQAQGIHATGNILKQQAWLSFTYIGAIVITYFLFKVGKNPFYSIYANIFIAVIQSLINLIYAKKTYSYSIKQFVKSILLPACLVLFLYGCILFLEDYIFIKKNVLHVLCILFTSICILPIPSLFILFNKQDRNKILVLLRKMLDR